MAQHNSLRESIKNIPVLGSVARSLNRVRIGLNGPVFWATGKEHVPSRKAHYSLEHPA
jgi:hypothetical protein